MFPPDPRHQAQCRSTVGHFTLCHVFCPCVLRYLCLDSGACTISLRFSVPFLSQVFSWSLFLFFPFPISLVSSLHKKRGLMSDHLHLCHLMFLPSSLSSNAFMATDVFTSRVKLHGGSKSMLFHQI